jgi:SAM-dependent methyltransferase
MPTIKMKTDKPVAFDSPDHIQPWGTANDNSTNEAFNQKIFWWLPKKDVRLLDIGCSGGGFVKSLINEGCLAVGVEGSDYSKRNKRAEWATIPGNLFTADATAPFELTMHDENIVEQIKFSVVTAWEFIEHIAEPDLEKVMRNISDHLAPNGIVIMSVSPNEEVINGVRLHQTVAEKPWWVAKFDSLGFTNHDEAVAYFDRDWIRGEENNAPNSFHVILTRKGEALPYPERITPLAYIYPKVSAGIAYLTTSFVKKGFFKHDPIVVIDVGSKQGFDAHWRAYDSDVELVALALPESECERLSAQEPPCGRKESYLPLVPGDRDETVQLFGTGDIKDGVVVTPLRPELAHRFKEGVTEIDARRAPARAVPLDSLVAMGTVSKPTFLKLDLKGGEIKALKGATQCLRTSVLGVAVDLDLQPFRTDAATLEQVQSLLSGFGFSLFDLKAENWVRSIVTNHDGPTMWHGKGQVARCKATFLRDMMPELEAPRRELTAEDKTKIMYVASLAEVLGFSDYSVELLVKSETLAG